MLADVVPTAYEVGVLNGQVSPADTVVVVGSGPIGLAAIKTARFFSPSHVVAIDIAQSRLDATHRFGAGHALLVDADSKAAVLELTDGFGADVVIEAVGVPESFELCTRLVRPGGRIANVGVYGQPATLHLEDLWTKNVTITTGLVDTHSTPTLLAMLASGQLDSEPLVTHHFALDGMLEAFNVFANASTTGALKVMLTRS